MRRRRFVRAAAALLLLGTATTALRAADPIPAEAKLVPDPAVKTGTLANGLRYAVMPNDGPAGAVSVRLLVKVGSYDEADDERGFAHFVEHMAFRSTRRAPHGVLDNRFAAHGVTLGQDHNAFTTMDSTVYKVDLPGNAPAARREVLQWLRDAADGIAFSPETVDVERRVIEAEERVRDTPIARAQQASALFQAPELRSTNRLQGAGEMLASTRAEALKAFHERWYRPENASLVVVGAVDPDEIAAEIEALFGDWAGKGPAPRRAPPQTVRARATDALVIEDPTLPAAISACRFAAPDIERTPSLERIRRETLTGLWGSILNSRLQRLTTASGSSLLGSMAITTRDGLDSRASCLVTVPADGRWKEALAAVQAELRRFAKDGPTEMEVTDAVAKINGQAQAAISDAPTRQTPTLADQLTAAELAGRIVESPEEAAASMELATRGVEASDIKQAFAHDWEGSGPVLTATLSDAVDKGEIVSAWLNNEKAAPLEAYVDRGTATWQYDFGGKGKVRKRTVFADTDVVRLDYGNGLIVNFKRTDFAADTVNIHVRLGHGLSGLAPEMRAPVGMGAGLLTAGGLGKLAADEIEGALGISNWQFGFTPDTHSWLITDSASRGMFGVQMHLLAAFVSDPGFRPLMDEKLPTAIDMVFRMMRTSPTAVASEAFEASLFPQERLSGIEEELRKWHAADFARVLKPVLTTSPVELTIVGDIDEKAVRRVVARTFGALPPRAPLAPPATSNPFRRFPEVPPKVVRGYHRGGGDKAGAMLVWPLYVATPERRSEEYALYLLSAVFRDRLLQRIRIQMGKVYSPEVDATMPDDADQGYLAAAFEASQDDLEALLGAARETAQKLARGEIDEKELLQAREPLLASHRQAMARNDAWAGALSYATRHPDALAELTRYEDQMGAVTLEDVRRAAATWLGRDPIVSLALPAVPDAGTPPAAVTAKAKPAPSPVG